MLESGGEQTRLRRLSAAIDTLQGDEGRRAMGINRRHELSLPIVFVVPTYHTA